MALAWGTVTLTVTQAWPETAKTRWHICRPQRQTRAAACCKLGGFLPVKPSCCGDSELRRPARTVLTCRVVSLICGNSPTWQWSPAVQSRQAALDSCQRIQCHGLHCKAPQQAMAYPVACFSAAASTLPVYSAGSLHIRPSCNRMSQREDVTKPRRLIPRSYEPVIALLIRHPCAHPILACQRPVFWRKASASDALCELRHASVALLFALAKQLRNTHTPIHQGAFLAFAVPKRAKATNALI